MTILEQLIEYSGEPINISKDADDNFMVQFDRCDVDDGAVLIGVCGRGKTIEQAAKDYIKQISGKKLVFNHNTDSERTAKFIIISYHPCTTCAHHRSHSSNDLVTYCKSCEGYSNWKEYKE